MEKHRLTRRVDTSAMFYYERWEEGPVQVLGPDDLWGVANEELRTALSVVQKLIFAAMTDRAFKREHIAALEGVEEVLEDLLHPEASDWGQE